jgi:ABC-type amino acid transport substrate-binding protein
MVGIDIDLVNEIAAELKVPVRYERSAKTFNQVVEVVADGKADFGISKLARTLARAKMVNYTMPYMGIKHALLVNRLAFAKIAKDRPAPQVIREFNGTLGVLAGASWEEFARKNFPKAEMVRFKTWELAVEAVKQGKIVAAYRDEFEIKRLLKEAPSAALTLRTVTLKDLEDTLGIAVSVNDLTLLAFVNQMLSQQRDKLDIQKVLNALETNP